jgi:hypothetical protein
MPVPPAVAAGGGGGAVEDPFLVDGVCNFRLKSVKNRLAAARNRAIGKASPPHKGLFAQGGTGMSRMPLSGGYEGPMNKEVRVDRGCCQLPAWAHVMARDATSAHSIRRVDVAMRTVPDRAATRQRPTATQQRRDTTSRVSQKPEAGCCSAEAKKKKQ